MFEGSKSCGRGKVDFEVVAKASYTEGDEGRGVDEVAGGVGRSFGGGLSSAAGACGLAVEGLAAVDVIHNEVLDRCAG